MVGEECYRVDRYEGAHKSIRYAVVLLCLKRRSTMTLDNLHCVLSTDRKLCNKDIFALLCRRWSIDSFSIKRKTTKPDGYRISRRWAVKRYWILVLLVYVYSMTRNPTATLTRRDASLSSLFIRKQSKILPKKQFHIAKGILVCCFF
jgi:hypothetical protein